MRIAKVSATNFKGAGFSHTLAPVTMFHGPPFAGKSSRLEAVTLALLGHLPGVAKAPKDVYERLAGNGLPLAVAVELDDGTVVGREFAERRGSIKHMATGPELDFPVVALDPSEFLDLSPRERVKYLFARAKLPDELTEQAVRDRLVAEAKNIRIEANSEDSEAAIREVVAFICGPRSEEHDGLQQWLELLVADAGVAKNAAVAAVKRLEQTQQGITQVSAPAFAAGNAEEDHRIALETLVAAEKELSRLEEAGRQARRALTQAEAAAGALDRSGALAEKLAALERDMAALNAELDAPVPDDTPARGHYNAMLAIQKTADAELAKASGELEHLRESIKRQKMETKCPHCGQDMAAISGPVLERMQKRLPELEEAEARAVKAVRTAEENCTAALQALDAIRGRLVARQVKFKARSDLAVQLERVRDALRSQDAAKQANDSLIGLAADLNVARDEWSKQQSVVENARQVAAAAGETARKAVAQRSEAALQAKARKELERLRAGAEVWKQSCTMFACLQSEIVAKVAGPLVAAANRLLTGILRAPLRYDPETCEIGFEGEGYSHRSFSGTEKALAYAGLSLALAAEAPFKLVLLDEMGRMDIDTRGVLVDRLLELVEDGFIDQAILAGVAGNGVGQLEGYAEIAVGNGGAK